MKWFVKYTKTLTYILYIVVAIVLVVGILNDFATTWVALACAGVLLAFTAVSMIVQNKVLSKAKQRMLEKCDPQEYNEITGALYQANIKAPKKVVDYCYALINSNLSNYESVRAALEQMQKNHTPITSKYVEALFHSLLCDAYIFFEKYNLAELSYRRAIEAYQGIKNEAQVEEVKDLLLNRLVELLIYKNDLERAEQEYNNIEEKSKKHIVEKLFLAAKLDIASGREEEGRLKLETVVKSANKLSLVEKAECLLSGKKPYPTEKSDDGDDEDVKEESLAPLEAEEAKEQLEQDIEQLDETAEKSLDE